MENKSLKWGKLVFKLALYGVYLAIAFTLLLIIDVLFELELIKNEHYLFSNEGLLLQAEINQDGERLNGSKGLMLFSMVQLIIGLVLTSFIIKGLIKIIHSVKQKASFATTNEIELKRIGTIFIGLFILNMLSIYPSESNGLTFKLDLEIYYLLCSLIAYILAAVFKEGNELEEENKLTI